MLRYAVEPHLQKREENRRERDKTKVRAAEAIEEGVTLFRKVKTEELKVLAENRRQVVQRIRSHGQDLEYVDVSVQDMTAVYSHLCKEFEGLGHLRDWSRRMEMELRALRAESQFLAEHIKGGQGSPQVHQRKSSAGLPPEQRDSANLVELQENPSSNGDLLLRPPDPVYPDT
uniref:Uncharacterized protein n=1 Tax=Fibrocapsa japonica TaxID=94617 RepID=A0A7S2USN3_9STRA|mmetsp:Transcript_11361/g.16757  ORF Transcript_11361/g.16757 Transcript_11361/m.16757 type:complete len:173 (+) Transcript_11361:122-640(+)